MAKLLKSTRSGVVIEIDGSPIEYKGEAFLPGYNSADFVFYHAGISNASTGEAIKASGAERYLKVLGQVAAEKGSKIEIVHELP